MRQIAAGLVVRGPDRVDLRRTRSETSRRRCSDWPHRTTTVSVVTDQVGQPTWTGDLAARIVELVTSDAPAGNYHGTNAVQASWYDFTRRAESTPNSGSTRTACCCRPTVRRSCARSPSAYSVLGHDGWSRAGLEPMRDWRGPLSPPCAPGALTRVTDAHPNVTPSTPGLATLGRERHQDRLHGRGRRGGGVLHRRQVDECPTRVRSMNPLWLVLAFLSVVVALLLSMLSWIVVWPAFGIRLPLLRGGRVFFVSQLGKYLPPAPCGRSPPMRRWPARSAWRSRRRSCCRSSRCWCRSPPASAWRVCSCRSSTCTCSRTTGGCRSSAWRSWSA